MLFLTKVLNKFSLFIEDCKGHEMVYVNSTIENLPYTEGKGFLNITYKERVVEHYKCKHCGKKSDTYLNN